MTLLPVHVVAGLIAIVAGFIAVFARKGQKLHRKSGKVFVYAMVIMSASATVMAIMLSQKLNPAQAVLTIYFVSTGVLAVRRRPEDSRWIEMSAMLVALVVALYEIMLGFDAMSRPKGTIDGLSPMVAFVFGSIALLAVIGDVRMLTRGIHGARRIARHLWRMCFGLFVATGSFFLGQTEVFPKPIRIIPLLAIPALLPLALLLYWMGRVLYTKWYRRAKESFGPMTASLSARP
jgi:uncharacterized membrane protein